MKKEIEKEKILKFFILKNLKVNNSELFLNDEDRIIIEDLKIGNENEEETYCSCDLNNIKMLYTILIRMKNKNYVIKDIKYKTIKSPFKKIDTNKYEFTFIDNTKYIVELENKRLFIKITVTSDNEKYIWKLKK